MIDRTEWIKRQFSFELTLGLYPNVVARVLVIAVGNGSSGAQASNSRYLFFRFDLDPHRAQDPQIFFGEVDGTVALVGRIAFSTLRPQPDFELQRQLHFKSRFAQALDRRSHHCRLLHRFIDGRADFFCQPFSLFVHFHSAMLRHSCGEFKL